MKLHLQPEEARADKKSLKPQVERRRRERMNRSMESLKSLLLQKQEDTQRRVEKAEILERTVLFLQSSARGDRLGCGGGESQRHSFQDGFSSCLQQAAQFLGPQGKGLWPAAALDASFSARFARSDPEPTSIQIRPEVRSPTSPLLLRKSSVSTLRMLINRSRLCKTALNVAQTRGKSHRSPSTPPQPHKGSSGTTKQSPSQSHPASQAMWRPWP